MLAMFARWIGTKITGGGGEPPSGDGSMNFTLPAQSGLLTLLFED